MSDIRQRGWLRQTSHATLVAVTVITTLSSCSSEIDIDPKQERNVRPGQRPEGSPRDEEQ